ncbi:MAG: sugar ABC transporter permease [Clostridia bacterium]|jgi:putative aldouronate transport system permease protein|nr:sugar ABC transporter permease [Clostridia bacterium]
MVAVPTVKKQKRTSDGRRVLSFSMALRRYWVLYIILFVIMAYYCLFHYYTIFLGIQMATRSVKLGFTIAESPFMGLGNFARIFKSKDVYSTIINTLRLSVSRLVWTFWPPIVLAIMLFDLTSRAYKRVCQTLVYIPHFFSWVVVYGIVYAVFSSDGFVNIVLANLGMEKINFLTAPSRFVGMLVGSQIWKGVGWGTILYFAALTNVNPELYEACKIDGAGPLRRTLVVTLPEMLPVVSFSLIMSLANILNNDFEQVLLYYNPSVYSVGDIIDTWVYREGLLNYQYSLGAAVSLMKASVSMVLVIGGNYLSRKLSGRGMW